MADLSALLDAVVKAPDTMAPRIAYAAAIVDDDPARAEYIQRAIKRAERPRDPSPEAIANSVALEKLEHAHGARWVAELPGFADGYGFRRGFVEDVRLDAPTFLSRAAELYRVTPILHLTLTGAAPVADALFASPLLDQIVSLSLMENQLGDDAIVALAGSPHLGNLRWLNLDFNDIGEAGLEALAASTALPRLGYVGLGHNRVPDPSPTHADEYDVDTKAAKELMRKHGRRAWLSAKPVRAQWPPPRDA